MKKLISIRIRLLVPLLFCICLLGNCDKPFEPVQFKNYPFYISAVNPSQVFVFYPATKKLDSIGIPWTPGLGVTPSADGKILYIPQGSSVLVVDADSFTVMTQLLYSPLYPVVVSPDDQYLAIAGYDLYIIRTSDYSLVFRDTAELLYSEGSFSSDSKSFYCASTASQGSNFVVSRVDLSDSLFQVTRTPFADGSVNQVISSIDDTKWFLYLAVGLWTYAFEVYDAVQDSIIFRDILVPGAGKMTSSPNGKYVFYTNPGRSATDPPSDLSFKIFDVEANMVEAIVSDTNFFCFGTGCAAPKFLAVTPDSRWLGVLGGDAFQIPAFYLYDVHKRELVYREIGNFPTTIRQYRYMSVQFKK